MALHYLAQNQDCQEKLREEVNREAQDICLDSSHLNNCHYLHSCIKEVLRLSPTSVGTARIIPQDLIIDSYTMPKKSILLACHPVICHLPQFFPEPERFDPDRWKNDDVNQPHPFASLPFGTGLRMCPGRRLAMQEIKLILIKLIQRYRIEPVNSSPVCMVMRMNLTPKSPLDFNFHCTK